MLRVITTSGKGTWQASTAAGAKGRAAGVIRVQPKRRDQPILGFGAALTDAACWMLSRLPSAPREQLMEELFSSEGLALSVCRICVGASDYARTPYTFDDTPDDLEMKHFSIDHDRAYIIPMIREARAANPDLFLFSSPWSPPGWMKTAGSTFGGWMREKYLEPYARYYLRFLKDYAAAGAAVQALTPQNEVETDQRCLMPACFWHPEFEMALVRDFLGPWLERDGMDVKIWLLDHNYAQWQRVAWQLKAPGVRRYVDGVAFHPYEGTPDMMDNLRRNDPHLALYWTEGGPHLDKNYATEWCRWSREITGILRHGCRSYTGWNVALDEAGRPNIGPFKCGGFVTLDSKTRRVTRSAQYWALGHFSKFMTRGSVRIGSTGEIKDVVHVAAVNPDGRRVLVVTNSAPAARTVRVQEGRWSAAVRLPGDSVTTLLWQP
jgi:glucosylceramidase